MSINDEFSLENPANRHSGKSTRLIPLKCTDHNYVQLESQFLQSWRHAKKARPHIHCIYKILFPAKSLTPYLQYKTRVQASSARCERSTGLPNEQLLFHGTSRHCLLGESRDRTRPCTLPECSVCCIIRNSFDVKKCGSRHKFRRFGSGIYTTACSSKADDYCSNEAAGSTFRMLLVNRVVVGKPLKKRQNATNLTEPPRGYHSVIGTPGIDLNYEETVVYDNDAIRPAYLIVYGDGPKLHSKAHAFLSALFKTPLAA